MDFVMVNRLDPGDDEHLENLIKYISDNRKLAIGGNVCAQFSPPYFDSATVSGFIDDKAGYLNLDARWFESLVKSKMKTTQKPNRVLSALKECGKLHSRKEEYYRYVDVVNKQQGKVPMKVYSVLPSLLDYESMKIINESVHADQYFPALKLPDDYFVPIISNDSGTKVAGTYIRPDSDVNRHIYISGKTRFGKSFFLAQQAILRAGVNDKIIIFDSHGSFALDELRKHLPQEIIDQYISLYDVMYKMPVDLLSIEGCRGTIEKCDRIYGTLSAAAKGFGSEQETVLRAVLMKLLQQSDPQTAVTAEKILEALNEKGEHQKKIKDKIAYAMMVIAEVSSGTKTWDEFLGNQKQVVILSVGDDSSNVGTQIVDMLIDSLYRYKVKNKSPHYTVILDEIQDLGLAQNGMLNTVLRKGGKMGLTFLLASQDYSNAADSALGRIIGNTGSKIFFRPKENQVSVVASETGVSEEQLRVLERGECIAVTNFYSRSKEENEFRSMIGKTAAISAMKPEKS